MENKIKEILSDNLGCRKKDVEPKNSLRQDLGMDSLDQAEIEMYLEEEFSTVESVDLDDVYSVQGLFDYMKTRV